MILSYENTEHIAAGVAKDFCCAIHAGEKKYEINIDRLAKAYLGLEVSYRTLSDDGSVLGVTAYRDAEYAVNAGHVMKIIPLKSNQVLLDRSLAVFSDNVAGTRRRRFTLAHECAHQILFQLEAQEGTAACRKPYALCMARRPRLLRTREDWREQAETVDKTLLPLDSAIQMKKVDVWQDTIPLTTPLKVISPVARTDAE